MASSSHVTGHLNWTRVKSRGMGGGRAERDSGLAFLIGKERPTTRLLQRIILSFPWKFPLIEFYYTQVLVCLYRGIVVIKGTREEPDEIGERYVGRPTLNAWHRLLPVSHKKNNTPRSVVEMVIGDPPVAFNGHDSDNQVQF